MTAPVKIITTITGAIIDTFVEVLTVDTRVDVMVAVSIVSVNLLMDALTVITSDIVTRIAVDVLVDVNSNVFAGIMTSFGFVKP